MDLKKHIRSIPDYPKKGILFRDITTLIKNSEAFKYTNDKIVEIAKKIEFDKVAAIESRGFVFASTISYLLDKPFILFRKKTNYQQMFTQLILNLNMEKQQLKCIKTQLKKMKKFL